MDCQYDPAEQTAITPSTIYQATKHKIELSDVADSQ